MISPSLQRSLGNVVNTNYLFLSEHQQLGSRDLMLIWGLKPTLLRFQGGMW